MLSTILPLYLWQILLIVNVIFVAFVLIYYKCTPDELGFTNCLSMALIVVSTLTIWLIYCVVRITTGMI